MHDKDWLWMRWMLLPLLPFAIWWAWSKSDETLQKTAGMVWNLQKV